MPAYAHHIKLTTHSANSIHLRNTKVWTGWTTIAVGESVVVTYKAFYLFVFRENPISIFSMIVYYYTLWEVYSSIILHIIIRYLRDGTG